MSKLRVLILDDHAQVRDLLASRLSEQPDFEVLGHTGCPEEAVTMAALHPDLILVDIRRLEDGPGACRSLAAAAPGARLVILTSYLREGEEELYRRIGVGACLVKKAGLEGPLADLRRLMGAPARA